jgi:DNA-binding MarR family transcriptional regulator
MKQFAMVEDIVRRKGHLTLGSRLRRIGERLQAETQSVMAAHGVPIQANQYPVLGAIDENGPLSIGDLAEALGVSQPGVTRLVGQLAKQGVVAVRRGSTDQRTRMVGLTDLGRDLVRQGHAMVWPQIEYCVSAVLAGATGPLLDQLDHLEDELRKASFARRIAGTGKDRGDGSP